MSEPNQESAASSERVTPDLPAASSIPVGGLGGEAGPADDLRDLIQHLNAALHETRHRLAMAELERDELRTLLEDSRAGFAEVMSVIRVRDEMAATIATHQKTITDLHGRLNVLHRQNAELHRQHDDARIEHAKTKEALKQADSLRHARDAAQAQCHNLIDKVQTLTDELAELAIERDQLVARLDQAAQPPQANQAPVEKQAPL